VAHAGGIPVKPHVPPPDDEPLLPELPVLPLLPPLLPLLPLLPLPLDPPLLVLPDPPLLADPLLLPELLVEPPPLLVLPEPPSLDVSPLPLAPSEVLALPLHAVVASRPPMTRIAAFRRARCTESIT
jgi:hypothetical protein